MTHFFLFPVYSNLFSTFGLGSGTIKTVPRNKFLFSWTITLNPITSRRMARDNVSGLARSQPKVINSVFYTSDSFCIYMSCVQHVIESNHFPSQRFSFGGEIIIYLISNICSTLWKIIEFEDLRFLDLLSSLVELCTGLAVDKIQRSFYPLTLFAQHMKKDINLFSLFQND